MLGIGISPNLRQPSDGGAGLSLDGWSIAVGTGEISLTPSGDPHLTIADNDDPSHASFPLGECYVFANQNAIDFRVENAMVTELNTDYQLTLDISFLAVGDRVTLRVYDNNGGILSSSFTPFTTAQTITIPYTTPGVHGELTHLRVNAQSLANPTTAYFNNLVNVAV